MAPRSDPSPAGVAKRIRQLRDDLYNGNTSAFAKDLGVAPNTVKRWAIGAGATEGKTAGTMLDITDAIRVSKLTGRSLEWIATGIDQPPHRLAEALEGAEAELSRVRKTVERI